MTVAFDASFGLVELAVVGAVVVVAAVPIIRPPYGAERILRASRRSRRCCITKRNWSNLVLVLLFSISILLHFVQIGWTEVDRSGGDVGDVVDDDDADDIDKSPLESRKSNVLALDASNVLVFGDATGVTGAELQLIGIWHWRQSIDFVAETGVAGNDVDFDVDDESLVT